MTHSFICEYFLLLQHDIYIGLKVVVCVLFGVELILSLVLIYWGSKAVCRPHFNTLVNKVQLKMKKKNYINNVNSDLCFITALDHYQAGWLNGCLLADES